MPAIVRQSPLCAGKPRGFIGTRLLKDLVLNAMRLAEYAHRRREHFRKAPPGEDRPAYFIHLAEVAWMLQEAGLPDEVVAAGYLHDLVEDCGWTPGSLARETGSERVAELVRLVSEPDRSHTWEQRNRSYFDRVRQADDDVLALSCADKTSNLRDMNRLAGKGYPPEAFTSRGRGAQLAKYRALGGVYTGRVPPVLYERFERALAEFEAASGA